MFERTFAVLAVVVCAPCAFAQKEADQALRRIDHSDLCVRSEEHTSELQSHLNLVCRLLLEKKKNKIRRPTAPWGAGKSPRGPTAWTPSCPHARTPRRATPNTNASAHRATTRRMVA